MRVPARPTHETCTPKAQDAESATVAKLRDQGLIAPLRQQGQALLGREWGCVICREPLTAPVILVIYGGAG